MMKIFTDSLIQSKSKVEVFEMIRVNKKSHPIHPTKLLLWHKDDVHLIKQFKICDVKKYKSEKIKKC